jgi:hypothetical protein
LWDGDVYALGVATIERDAGGDSVTRTSGPDSEVTPRLAVYATAAGLATAVPLPLLDRALSGLARGAALRHVASRHGVRLTREARQMLVSELTGGNKKMRLARAALVHLTAPLRIASRVDDALSTWSAAVLLDHYLVTRPRAPHAALGGAEARAVKDAIDSAEVHGVLASLRAAPSALGRSVVDAVKSAGQLDLEDRTPLERVFDTLLDRAADAPEEIGVRLRAAFDHAFEHPSAPREEAR